MRQTSRSSAWPMMPRRWLLFVLLSTLLPAAASAQMGDVLQLYLAVDAKKEKANPTGTLKAQLDSIERDVMAAYNDGRRADAFRLLMRASVLLEGQEWNESREFSRSLTVTSDRVLVDPDSALTVRLGQVYSTPAASARTLSLHLALQTRPRGAQARGGAVSVVKDFGAFDGVQGNLFDSPHAVRVDLRGVSNGTYELMVVAMDGARVVGAPRTVVLVRNGIDSVARGLERAASSAPASLRADILYPVDRMRTINRGSIELRTLDVEKDFAAAQAVAAAAAAKHDPFAGRTGDMERHYVLEAADEVMPYRLYVPTFYSPGRPLPLIVALHGLTDTEDAFFDSYDGKLPALAEQHGYLVVAPLGYRTDGFYGYGVGAPPRDPATRRVQDLSEQDVLHVLDEVRKRYAVDARRVYLMGHSMGAIGTWNLAAKYPDKWAALGVFSGTGDSSTVERMRRIPQFVVHGDADITVRVTGSRRMVAAMKARQVDVEYIEVPGGDHSGVVVPNLEAMFRFFDARATRRDRGS